MSRTICVFCASSRWTSQSFLTATDQWIEKLSAMGWGIVYGGGAIGLMGQVSRTARRLSAPLTAVIPRSFIAQGWLDPNVTNVVEVNTLSERKQRMLDLSDVVLILPGGTGTFDELFFAIESKKLAEHPKPIVIANFDGFFNPLIEQFDNMMSCKLINEKHRHIFYVANSVDELLSYISSYNETQYTLTDAEV